MQQPQTRPLLGDSVSSTTSPTTRRGNSVTVLTHQQLQQIQQLQAHNSTGQQLTFALQQSSNNGQDQANGSATGNHIVYLNQLSQLNQNTINQSGTGMGLPPAGPTFGVGLNMGLPLSLLNTSLTSLTSNVITTSNPLLNIGLPSSINPGITTVNTDLNTLNAINSTLNSNLPSNSITNGLAGLAQDINAINSGINRLNTLNSSGLSNINSGLSANLNQNFATLNANVGENNSGLSNLSSHTSQSSSSINQNFSRSLNVLAGITPSSLNSCNTNFPFQTIQSIQSIAPHIVGSSVNQVPSSAIQQHSNSSGVSISHSSNLALSSNVYTSTSNTPILSTTASANQSSNVTHNQSIHLGVMHTNQPNVSASHFSTVNDSINTLSHISAIGSSHNTGFQQRQFSQAQNSNLGSINISGNQTSNTVKTVQNIQSQNVSSPGSPFSMPLKSPASNIAPPTPSPSPNRVLLRSPASNSIQSNRNSPSPVATSNSNFSMQLQSPMQSPMSVGQIQSPAPSPYPPAKSPHHLGSNTTLNNRSPAPGGSPGPPVVRPNTPILQQGMQVLQIIGTPQGYQQASSQLVTRTHLFGNQQIQIAATKPAKQPPQILPKPPNQQGVATQQKQRVTTTITNQVI
ncbi:hypothetical protein G9C98_002384 [Cotesia typhae]|uniref:Uncharacterized protein n=1 Tax=Cotesia typhae TaxID=2053667 RepID=A0A8J5QYD9_9HYME|nr:hypothetical protein G9C98_002384 [Cotesia typhae]